MQPPRPLRVLRAAAPPSLPLRFRAVDTFPAVEASPTPAGASYYLSRLCAMSAPAPPPGAVAAAAAPPDFPHCLPFLTFPQPLLTPFALLMMQDAEAAGTSTELQHVSRLMVSFLSRIFPFDDCGLPDSTVGSPAVVARFREYMERGRALIVALLVAASVVACVEAASQLPAGTTLAPAAAATRATAVFTAMVEFLRVRPSQHHTGRTVVAATATAGGGSGSSATSVTGSGGGGVEDGGDGTPAAAAAGAPTFETEVAALVAALDHRVVTASVGDAVSVDCLAARTDAALRDAETAAGPLAMLQARSDAAPLSTHAAMLLPFLEGELDAVRVVTLTRVVDACRTAEVEGVDQLGAVASTALAEVHARYTEWSRAHLVEAVACLAAAETAWVAQAAPALVPPGRPLPPPIRRWLTADLFDALSSAAAAGGAAP